MSLGQLSEIAVLETHQTAVASLVDAARTHRIIDDQTRGMAADIRSALRQAEKRVEEARTALVKPLNDHVRSINAKFKPLSDCLASAVQTLDGEIVRDRREREAAAERERQRLEQERLAAEKKAREEQEQRAREAEEKARKDAAAAGMTAKDQEEVGRLFAADVKAEPLPPVIQAAPPPMPARTIAGASGVASVKKLWDFELKDVGALAAAYPATVEVKRAGVLAILRELEQRGASEAEIEKVVPGIRAFKRDSVSG